jgi:hypothetical protein
MIQHSRPHLARVWLLGAVLVSLVLLVATCFRVEAWEGAGAVTVLRAFDLGLESNVAAWWSGMLLLVAAVHAFDGYALWRDRQPRVARGWATIAALLLLLSADEIGSLHESTKPIRQWLGFSPLLPIGAIGCVVLAHALNALRAAESRRTIGLILLAFGLFGTVVLQELLEQRLDLESAAARAARTVAEEGTELLGILLLLGVCMRNTAAFWRRGGDPAAPSFEALCLLRGRLAFAALLLAPFLAAADLVLAEPGHGRPADWLAAAAFLAAALALLRRSFEPGTRFGGRDWCLFALCCLASVIVVQTHPATTIDLLGVHLGERMLRLSIVLLAIGAISLLNARPAAKESHVLGVSALALLLPLASWWAHPLLALGVSPIAGAIVYYVHAAPNARRAAAPAGSHLPSSA